MMGSCSAGHNYRIFGRRLTIMRTAFRPFSSIISENPAFHSDFAFDVSPAASISGFSR
jgi:hypothetical protein